MPPFKILNTKNQKATTESFPQHHTPNHLQLDMPAYLPQSAFYPYFFLPLQKYTIHQELLTIPPTFPLHHYLSTINYALLTRIERI